MAAVFAALGAVVLSVPALADKYDAQIPEKPKRYVTDRAGVFGPGEADALNARLEQFERDTSDQVLVWVDRKIPEGFTLEDFTVRAAQKWGAGQKKEDNGAVLFVFTEDRKVRIEVGYGLEGALPDITAKQIIDGEIVPRFRAGDYAGGIAAGAAAMMAAVKGEYKGTGRTVNEGRRRRNDSSRRLPHGRDLPRGLRRPADHVPPQPLSQPWGRRLVGRFRRLRRRARRRWVRRVRGRRRGILGRRVLGRRRLVRRRRRLGELVAREHITFRKFDSDRIVAAIAAAEKPKSSGEIRVHVTRRVPEDLEQRARRRVDMLGMTKTASATAPP